MRGGDGGVRAEGRVRQRVRGALWSLRRPGRSPRMSRELRWRAVAASGSAKTDREALVALYNATDGENWDESNNWLSDAPLGEWEGVTTNDDRLLGALAGRYRWSLSNLTSNLRRQLLERGDTAGAGQPLQPDTSGPQRHGRLERVRAKQPGRPGWLLFSLGEPVLLLLKPRALSRGRTTYRPGRRSQLRVPAMSPVKTGGKENDHYTNDKIRDPVERCPCAGPYGGACGLRL